MHACMHVCVHTYLTTCVTFVLPARDGFDGARVPRAVKNMSSAPSQACQLLPEESWYLEQHNMNG